MRKAVAAWTTAMAALTMLTTLLPRQSGYLHLNTPASECLCTSLGRGIYLIFFCQHDITSIIMPIVVYIVQPKGRNA